VDREQTPPAGRVLYLSWRDLDHPEGGGAELWAERTAAGLAQHGYDVTIFCARWHGAAREVERDGFRIVRRGHRYTVYLWALVHLVLHGRRYDTVIDVQNGVPFWSPLVYRGRIINLNHHVHREQWWSFFSAPVARLGWFLESRVAPRVYRGQGYVTVSRSSFDDLVSIGVDPARITISYGGVDPAMVPDSPVAADVRTPHPTIVSVSRLVPHKRIELAISALRALSTDLPDLVLHVVGEGYWLPELQAHAELEGVADRVVFHGFVDDAVKQTLLSTSWVMAMPSAKEGWGLTITEAAQHATPSVAFAEAGGTRESIQDGVTGLLADDDAHFEASLRLLLTDHELREKLGHNAREHAAGFGWADTTRDLLRVLRDET
jgi:glycosyltransferase involved in cell wall biosynthesis